MANVRRILAIGLLCLGGPSCDGSSESVPIGDFQVRGLEAICDRDVRCGFFPDQATCQEVFFTNDQFVADVDSGRVKYDGQAAASCLTLMASLSCKVTDQSPSGILALQQTCNSIATGTASNGGACLNAAECISQNCNLSACNGAMCCSGSCQAQVAVGGDCLAVGAACVAGTFCKRATAGSSALCTAWVPAGQPCDSSDQCAPGTICDTDPTTGIGTCHQPPAQGQPCPGGRCDSSLDVCDSTSKTCVPLVAVGGSCTSTDSCVSYAICDPATMTCVARVAPGGTCAMSEDCIGDLPCSQGICVAATETAACP